MASSCCLRPANREDARLIFTLLAHLFSVSHYLSLSLLACTTDRALDRTRDPRTTDRKLERMAHKTFTAPKVWRRPYTSIYNDNYRFGNSLYSGAVADIENRSKGYTPYFASPNSASLITDPGVRRAILEAELLTSSDILPSGMMEMAVSS